MKSQHLFLICWSLLQCYYLNHLTYGMCIPHEREALLKFKHGIRQDNCGLLSSWSDDEHNRNCCQWHGVHCSNHTSHVIKLNLRGVVVEDTVVEGNCLQGKLSSYLVDLKHLTYLDLSYNFFDYSPIPSFIGSLSKLEYLNLSHSALQGDIPHQLGNLSRLTSLDLSYMLFNGYDISTVGGYASYISVENLSWLSRLTLLRFIDLSGADLSKVTDWLQVVNRLPSLRVLRLIYCQLPSKVAVPRPLSYRNSSATLSVVILTRNDLNNSSILFQWLFNLSGINTHLAHLDLSMNQLQGPLPSSFGNLQALSYLDLSNNYFDGTVPTSFGKLQSLSHLSLSQNRFHGQIPDISSENLTYLDLSSNKFQSWPKTICQLCSLQELFLNFNNLTEELPAIIQTLTGSECANSSLMYLDLSNNQIWGSIPSNINAFSSLSGLSLGANQLNGTISQSLGQLSKLIFLNLSSNSLKGSLLTSHFLNLSELVTLDLSYNPELKFEANPPYQISNIMLSSCRLGPSFPKWLLAQKSFMVLDVSSAGISDQIPESFWNSLSPQLLFLNMSHNNIYGTLPELHQLSSEFMAQKIGIDLSFNSFEGAIPSFFLKTLTSLLLNNNKFSDAKLFLCPKNMSSLTNLDLSNNFLSGELPDCWMNFSQLSILHIANNNFSGAIPASISYLNQLQGLHLRNNSFSGEVPRLLENLSSLVILDLAHNSLSGLIQPTIGKNMESLGFLSLRSNHFFGEIPVSLCQFSNLQILDLAVNHITGSIPKCISNLTAMKTGMDLLPDLQYNIRRDSNIFTYDTYTDAATIMWKRKEWSFMNSLGQVKQIDISNNHLQGEIPNELFSLTGLVSLDLSSNNLSGTIMPKIGELTALQFLDLSDNHLSGEIPRSLADLNFLGILDLSYNHLSGTIPTGTLLQSFDFSAYAGNPDLCGTPLAKCPWDQRPNVNTVHGDSISHNDDDESEDIYPGLYISVVLGFIVGFWVVCGSLVLKTSWRHAFFRSFVT